MNSPVSIVYTREGGLVYIYSDSKTSNPNTPIAFTFNPKLKEEEKEEDEQ